MEVVSVAHYMVYGTQCVMYIREEVILFAGYAVHATCAWKQTNSR